MWALCLVAPQRFEPRDVAAPDEAALRPGEVVLRTLAGGICGSDIPLFRGMRPLDAPDGSPLAPPGFPAHEVVGAVVASRHDEISVGDTVVGWATATDAIAEYVVTRGDSLAAYSMGLAAEIAVMLQPLACVLAAVDRLGDIAGRSVAVLGQGPIGVLFSHVVKHAGASHVIGVDRVDRGDVASTFGVDEPVWASADSWVRTLAPGERPQFVIEAIGHQTSTLRLAVEAVAPRGSIYYFGIPDERVYPFPMDLFLRKDLSLHAGVTRERRRWLAAANTYLARHPELATTYVTDIFPSTEVGAAYQRAAHPRRGQLKIVFRAPS